MLDAIHMPNPMADSFLTVQANLLGLCRFFWLLLLVTGKNPQRPDGIGNGRRTFVRAFCERLGATARLASWRLDSN
jgi:hypothetical protein